MVGDAGSTQNGTITASYASGAVHAVAGSTSRTGGLVGFHRHGNINQSYSYGGVTFTGTDTSNYVGGLVGNRETTQGIVTDSYYDRETSGRSDTGEGDPKTTRELQTPTGYDDPYAGWNVNVDGDDGADDPWDFGTPRHYPALKIDFNGDGRATCREFGPQRCYREPGPPPYNWQADHPEIYTNVRTGITASCAVRTTGTGDAAITTSTLTFNLAEYTRPITLGPIPMGPHPLPQPPIPGDSHASLAAQRPNRDGTGSHRPGPDALPAGRPIRPESGARVCGLPHG